MIDHSQCGHESSKGARARCRRERTASYALADLNHVVVLAYELFEKYGLDQRGWQFGWDSSLRRFGHCIWLADGQKIIQLSAPLTRLCTREQYENTLLHEIAHALVGIEHGHDDAWKAKCVEIGADPGTYFKGYHDLPVKTRYTLVCDNCGKRYHRHKRSKNLYKLMCGVCKSDLRVVEN